MARTSAEVWPGWFQRFIEAAKATAFLLSHDTELPRALAPHGTASETIEIRLGADPLAALDKFILEQDPTMTRNAAIELAIQDWLIGLGFLPVGEETEDV